MIDILYPTYYGVTDKDRFMSKSLIEIVSWAKSQNADFVSVRHVFGDGSVSLRICHAYEIKNNKAIRVV